MKGRSPLIDSFKKCLSFLASFLGPGLIFLLVLFLPWQLPAQTEIGLGTWRAHISYNSIHDVAFGSSKVFAAAESGLVIFDATDNSLTTLSKVKGLTSTGISAIAYDPATNQFIVGYESGGFDLIRNGLLRHFNPTQTAAVTGSKRINDVAIQNSLAYIATDYGIVLFDLLRSEVKETWRDLGAGGAVLKIFKIAFLSNNIFVAAEKGVMRGDLGSNLLDFNNWERFQSGDFNTAIMAIASFNTRIYTSINGVGIYKYEGGTWSKEAFPITNARDLNGSTSNLLIAEGAGVWLLNSANTLQQITDPLLIAPLTAQQDDSGKLWIGDESNGLISNTSGSFQRYLPNGPTVTSSHRLRYVDNKIVLAPGGYSGAFVPLKRNGALNIFENGKWSTLLLPVNDLTDAAHTAGNLYVASFGSGVAEISNGTVKVFDQTNSTLLDGPAPGTDILVTGLASASDGLWVTSYAAIKPLHFYDQTQWKSFSFPFITAQYPVEVEVDDTGIVWFVLDPSRGGGVVAFDPVADEHVYLSAGVGAGNLPVNSVRSIAVDRKGNVWVGTDAGVAYFFDMHSDAIRPIFGSRFLLTDDRVTAIAVDGGDRKWLGTTRGVWLFDPTGEELVHNFTADNSPLLSNNIIDIAIHALTGEAFFATDKGVVSFRSDATQGKPQFESIRIFPNPVTRDFNGLVGISGLATDAFVKITDARGKLVFQTRAHGGTASWELRDLSGRRVPTGIFLVFAATEDASDRVVGKIVVVD